MNKTLHGKIVAAAIACTALASCDPVNNPGGFGLGVTAMVIVITLFSLLVTAVPIVFVVIYMVKLMKKKAESDKVLATGQQATGTVMRLSETGTMINNQPLVNIVLNVQRPGIPPYQVMVQKVISQLEIPRLQPGMTVAVKVDPANPQSVAIDLNQPVNVAKFCNYCKQTIPSDARACPHCGAPVA